MSIVIIFGIIAGLVTTNSKLRDIEDIKKNLQSFLKGLKSTEEIREKIDLLIGKVDALSNEVTASRYQSDSLVSLSQYGKSLSKKIDAKSITDRYKGQLTKKAKKQEMNAYQIQQSYFYFAQNKIPKDLEENSKEQYDQLANVAFNEGIQIRDLMRVLGLILRDQTLKACDISVSDVASKTREPAAGVADIDFQNNYSKNFAR